MRERVPCILAAGNPDKHLHVPAVYLTNYTYSPGNQRGGVSISVMFFVAGGAPLIGSTPGYRVLKAICH